MSICWWLFVVFSCHTPGITPIVMENLLYQHVHDLNGKISSKEMKILSKQSRDLPCGCCSIWEREND